MKPILLTIFILIITNKNSFSQNLELVFWNNNEKINNVYIYDEMNKIYLNSNELNIIILPKNNYTFKITHISFITKYISISSRDSIININLEKKVNNKEIVIVKSKKYKEVDNLFIGNLGTKTSSKIRMGIDGKLGFLIPNINNKREYYIKKIKFKMHRTFKKYKLDEYIEIKLYEIGIDTLYEEPLNSKLIKVSFESLKKTNTIPINELIEFPRNGLFISIEIPSFNINKNQQNFIEIPIESKTGLYPNLITSTYKNWTLKMVRSKGLLDFKTKISFSPLFQIELVQYD